MGVLDGFYATWQNARQAFGVGTVQAGHGFDQSNALRWLESGLAAAAPGPRWTGAAAANYAVANTEHRCVIGELADLDQRLRTHVNQSAEIVAAGRRDLDSVRQWVTDAANSVPAGRMRERLLLPIAHNGLCRIREIVTQCHGELGGISDRICADTRQYQVVGEHQKFGDG